MSVRLFVEGGRARSKAGTLGLRTAVTQLLRSRLDGRMPRVIEGGDRDQAFRMFQKALEEKNGACVLLVDSEGPANTGDDVWAVLSRSSGWHRPPTSSESQVHLFVQAMESWLLVDAYALKDVLGPSANTSKLPTSNARLRMTPAQLLAKLETIAGPERPFDKTRDGRRILERVNLETLIAEDEWARRLIDHLEEIC